MGRSQGRFFEKNGSILLSYAMKRFTPAFTLKSAKLGNRRLPTFAVIFCLIILLLVGFALYKTYKATQTIIVKNFHPTPTHSLYKNKIEEHFAQKSPFAIALLGYPGGKFEGTYLTDSIIVAYIQPAKHSLSLISIPRDLWVRFTPPSGEQKEMKINAVYESGFRENQTDPALGMANIEKALTEVTGLPLEHSLAVTFQGFIATIDELGGIDVYVERAFTDEEYPLMGMENDLCGPKEEELPTLVKIATISAVQAFPCRFETIHFDRGNHHLTGEEALKFVRSRHSKEDGSDYARSRRQRALLTAVKEKVYSVSFPAKIFSLLEILGNNVRTDISLAEMKELLKHQDELKDYHIDSIALTDENVLTYSFSSDGQYILVPKAGDGWQSIQTFIKQQLEKSPTPSPATKL